MPGGVEQPGVLRPSLFPGKRFEGLKHRVVGRHAYARGLDGSWRLIGRSMKGRKHIRPAHPHVLDISLAQTTSSSSSSDTPKPTKPNFPASSLLFSYPQTKHNRQNALLNSCRYCLVCCRQRQDDPHRRRPERPHLHSQRHHRRRW